MIKSIEIQNCQSHDKTTLEFSEGCNIIVGSSDSGKTAIIRTIRKVVWNRPSGNGIQSHWGGTSLCRINTEEGSVTWSKDKVDTYQLDIHGQKSMEFKAFGTSVPEEISRFLNINEINLQQQLDAPFLLSKTSGEVAIHFNKIANLTKIDTGTTAAKKAIAELNATIGREKTKDLPATGLIKRINDAETQLVNYAYLEKMEIDIEVLETMEKNLLSAFQKQHTLEQVINKIKQNKIDIQEQKPLIELAPLLDKVFALDKKLEDAEKDNANLGNLLIKIQENQTDIQEQNVLLSLEKPITKALRLYEEFRIADNDRISLSKAISTIKGNRVSLERAKAEYERKHTAFEKNMPDVCLFCGNKIKR